MAEQRLGAGAGRGGDDGQPDDAEHVKTVLQWLQARAREVDQRKKRPESKMLDAFAAALDAAVADDGEHVAEAVVRACDELDMANWSHADDRARVAAVVREHARAGLVLLAVLRHAWVHAHHDRHWAALVEALARDETLWTRAAVVRPFFADRGASWLLALLLVPPHHAAASCEAVALTSLLMARFVAAVAVAVVAPVPASSPSPPASPVSPGSLSSSSSDSPMSSPSPSDLPAPPASGTLATDRIVDVHEPPELFTRLVRQVTAHARHEKKEPRPRAAFATWMGSVTKARRSMLDRVIDTMIVESAGGDRRCIPCAKASIMAAEALLALARLLPRHERLVTAVTAITTVTTPCATDTTIGDPLPRTKDGRWICAQCHATTAVTGWRMCPVCKLVVYCSRDCRKAHGPAHKRTCTRSAVGGAAVPVVKAAAAASTTTTTDPR